jgi:hypothetical protein
LKNIIFDENIAPRLIRAIEVLCKGENYKIDSVVNKFGCGTTDREWLNGIAKEGNWIILSGDHHIKTRKHEIEAFKASGSVAFFLPKYFNNTFDFWDKASFICRWWKIIISQGNDAPPKSIFHIPHKWTPKRIKENSN